MKIRVVNSNSKIKSAGEKMLLCSKNAHRTVLEIKKKQQANKNIFVVDQCKDYFFQPKDLMRVGKNTARYQI